MFLGNCEQSVELACKITSADAGANLNLDVDLGAVECATPLINCEFPFFAVQCIPKSSFSSGPHFIRPDRIFRSGGQIHLELAEAKLSQDVLDKAQQLLDLRHNLLRGAEDVGIILHSYLGADDVPPHPGVYPTQKCALLADTILDDIRAFIPRFPASRMLQNRTQRNHDGGLSPVLRQAW